MKTIKLAVDDKFGEMLTGLARRTNTTETAVIRKAVFNYRNELGREELRGRIKEASKKVREQSLEEAAVWEGTIGDGL